MADPYPDLNYNFFLLIFFLWMETPHSEDVRIYQTIALANMRKMTQVLYTWRNQNQLVVILRESVYFFCLDFKFHHNVWVLLFTTYF